LLLQIILYLYKPIYNDRTIGNNTTNSELNHIDMNSTYKDFQAQFQKLVHERHDIIKNTLSNIFTMRLIGNKTHGDLAEIGIEEFINQYMDGYKCKHVGKDLYRAKEHEEDIVVTDARTNEEIPISLKAYGEGPLQLSTDKEAKLFPELERRGDDITDMSVIRDIFNSDAFTSILKVNVMPLIYNEHEMICNIMVFDFESMMRNTKRILRIPKGKKYDDATKSLTEAKKRAYPIYMFIDGDGRYICEVRYGDAAANALQRGFWTHTGRASQYFNKLTGDDGISYEHNHTLVKLFKLALNATINGHDEVCKLLEEDIKKNANRH
jgi:hypothetical protein